jgi:hypothetical protein
MWHVGPLFAMAIVAVALGPVLGKKMVSRFLVDAMDQYGNRELRFGLHAVGPGRLFRAKKAKSSKF